MAEYIERETAIAWFMPYAHAGESIDADVVISDIKGMKAADVVPVRHGFWIDTGFVNSTGKIFLCSECNHNHNPNKKDVAAGRVEERPKHCPGCGARMDLEG